VGEQVADGDRLPNRGGIAKIASDEVAQGELAFFR
jgi:hypothetical protein